MENATAQEKASYLAERRSCREPLGSGALRLRGTSRTRCALVMRLGCAEPLGLAERRSAARPALEEELRSSNDERRCRHRRCLPRTKRTLELRTGNGRLAVKYEHCNGHRRLSRNFAQASCASLGRVPPEGFARGVSAQRDA